MEKEKGSSSLKDLLLVAGGALGAEMVRYLSQQSNKEEIALEATDGLTRIMNFPESTVRNALLRFISGISQNSLKTKILAIIGKMDDDTLKNLADSPEAQKQLLEITPSNMGESFKGFLDDVKKNWAEADRIIKEKLVKSPDERASELAEARATYERQKVERLARRAQKEKRRKNKRRRD